MTLVKGALGFLGFIHYQNVRKGALWLQEVIYGCSLLPFLQAVWGIKPYFLLPHGVPRVDALLVNGVIFAITHALQWKEVLREYPDDGSWWRSRSYLWFRDRSNQCNKSFPFSMKYLVIIRLDIYYIELAVFLKRPAQDFPGRPFYIQEEQMELFCSE